MAVNKGVYPLDPTSETGKFRLLIGDTTSVPLVPPETGFQDYSLFSDDEIEVFLAQSEGSLDGGAYFAYLSLASSAAMASKTVRDFDLQIDNTKRAADLRAVAQMWLDKWNASSADIFETFSISTSDCTCVPELAPRPACRRGCNGSQFF